ncbi:MAG TPA: hypothetical protein VFI23_08020 [Rhizomicrobium sp.]|nr:hypothetical protein [Rhizomicrobium sp.]
MDRIQEEPDAFLDWCKTAIAERRAYLAPLETGLARVARRPYGGHWEDITPFRIEQLKREIAGLQNAMSRHRTNWG